jgi:acyl dehydratase
VRPGDELSTRSEILETRPSKSRPDQGLIKVRTTTLNQDGEAVQILVANMMVPRRPIATAPTAVADAGAEPVHRER